MIIDAVTMSVGWARTLKLKRMRALLVTFVFVVVLAASGSWLLHSLVIRATLEGVPKQLVCVSE